MHIQVGLPLTPSHLAPSQLPVCWAWLSLIIEGGAEGRMGPGWAEGYVCTKSSGLCLSLACTRNLPEVFGGLNCSPQRGRELGRMQPSTRKPPGLQHGQAGEAQDGNGSTLYLCRQLLLLQARDSSVSGGRFMLSFCYDISLLDVSITAVVNGHRLFCFGEAEHHSGGIFLDPRSSGSPGMTSVNLPNHCQ